MSRVKRLLLAITFLFLSCEIVAAAHAWVYQAWLKLSEGQKSSSPAKSSRG
jgi:hypothetical protein